MANLADVIKRMKGYSWLQLSCLPNIERYVLGGVAAELAHISPQKQQYYVVHEFAEALRKPEAWQDEDRRAVHALVALGMADDVWRWMGENLRRETPGQDFHGIVTREILATKKWDVRKMLAGMLPYVAKLVTNGSPTSAGRWVLSLKLDDLAAGLEAAKKNASAYWSTGSLAELLLIHAPKTAKALADQLLESPRNGGIEVETARLMIKHDPAGLERHLLAAVKPPDANATTRWQVARILLEHDARHDMLAFDVASETITARGPHGADEVVEWATRRFGGRIAPAVNEHLRRQGAGADEDVIKSAGQNLGKESLDGLLAVLDACNRKLAKPPPAKSDYSEKWARNRVNTVRTAVLEQLIAMKDPSQDDRLLRELQDGLSADDAETVIGFLTLAGKWDAKRLKEEIWRLLEHKSKPTREATARVLARDGDDAITRAQTLLSHKKGDVRMAAAYLLAQVNTPAANEILEANLDKEANDDVRDQMLIGLEQAWAKQGRKVSKKDVERRIRRLGDKLDEPVDTAGKWLKEDKLPALSWSDGGKLNKQAVRYLLYRQSRAKEMRPDVEAKAMYELIDRKTSGDFARAVLEGFFRSKMESADRWTMVVAARLGGDRLVPLLAGQIREWVDQNRGKLAEYAVQALAQLGTDAALLSVDAMAIRYRNKMKNVGKAAVEAFAGAAEQLGISTDELGDRVVPWLGFEPGKPRIIETGKGDAHFEASIGLDFKLTYRDVEKNKPVKALPKSCPAEVLTELKEVSANLKEAVKAQLLRVENLLVRQRRWPMARWKELFLAHPLLLPFAVRLVWGHYDEEGKRLGLFRALADRTLTTNEDDAYDLGESGMVGMVHPLEMDDETKQAWQNHLADYEIEPPFPQLEREVVRVDEKQAAEKVYSAIDGKSLNAMTFKGRAERFGWHRGSVCDGGGITSYVKTFPTAGADVILGVEDFYIGIDMYSDMKLGSVMFVKSGSVQFGSYTYDEPTSGDDPRVLKFADVPPIVFSEAMGDLTKIAGKTESEGVES